MRVFAGGGRPRETGLWSSARGLAGGPCRTVLRGYQGSQPGRPTGRGHVADRHTTEARIRDQGMPSGVGFAALAAAFGRDSTTLQPGVEGGTAGGCHAGAGQGSRGPEVRLSDGRPGARGFGQERARARHREHGPRPRPSDRVGRSRRRDLFTRGGPAGPLGIFADPWIAGVIGASCPATAVGASSVNAEARPTMIDPSNTSPRPNLGAGGHWRSRPPSRLRPRVVQRSDGPRLECPAV